MRTKFPLIVSLIKTTAKKNGLHCQLFSQRRLEWGAGSTVAKVWEPSAQEWDLWNPDSPYINVFLPYLVNVLLDIIMCSAYILLFYLINTILKMISADCKWQENFLRHMNKTGLKCSEENIVSDILIWKKKQLINLEPDREGSLSKRLCASTQLRAKTGGWGSGEPNFEPHIPETF